MGGKLLHGQKNKNGGNVKKKFWAGLAIGLIALLFSQLSSAGFLTPVRDQAPKFTGSGATLSCGFGLNKWRKIQGEQDRLYDFVSGTSNSSFADDGDFASSGESADPSWPPTQAPEPATLLLMGTGLLGIATVFRKKKA